MKRHLRAKGFQILGGQPPSGTDHFPVLEIKGLVDSARGSRESFKPDLVAFSDGSIWIIEIKPKFSSLDSIKLSEVLGSKTRIGNFISELIQRRIRIDGEVLDSMDKVHKYNLEVALAYAGPEGIHPHSEFRWVSDGFVETRRAQASMSVASAMILP